MWNYRRMYVFSGETRYSKQSVYEYTKHIFASPSPNVEKKVHWVEISCKEKFFECSGQ